MTILIEIFLNTRHSNDFYCDFWQPTQQPTHKMCILYHLLKYDASFHNLIKINKRPESITIY